MDEELLRLYLRAAGTRSGTGRVTKNLQDPILGVLTGSYNPMADMAAGGGDLWNTYSQIGDPDMSAVLNLIQGGADKYQVSSAINQLYGANPQAFAGLGMQPEDVSSLARDLQKEYTSGGKQQWWEEAGLSSPVETYTLETVPLAGKAAQRVAELQKSQIDIESKKQKEQGVIDSFRKFWEKQKSNKSPSVQAQYATEYAKMSKALANMSELDKKSRELSGRQDAVRRGAMARALESGRTPLMDQLRTRLTAQSGF